jgi:hypothetical protein
MVGGTGWDGMCVVPLSLASTLWKWILGERGGFVLYLLFENRSGVYVTRFSRKSMFLGSVGIGKAFLLHTPVREAMCAG